MSRKDLPNAVDADAPDELTIKDDETQTYVFDVTTDDPEEGTPINVDPQGRPCARGRCGINRSMTLHSSDAKYTLSVPTVTITEMTDQAGVAFTLTAPNEDGNRVDDSVTLKAFTGTLGRPVERAAITIKVADINALPAVAMVVTDKDGEVLDPQPTSVEEGTSIYVAVRPLDEDGDADDATEKLTVALTPTGTADASDYTLVGAFTIESGDDISNPVELAVRGEDDDVGTDTLMFDATVSGEEANGTETSPSPGVLSLMITDATTPKITPKASTADYEALMAAIAAGGGDDGVNPGDTVTLMTGDLFDDGARLHGQLRRLRGGRLCQCIRVGRGSHDQRAEGRRGQDHRHRDGENGIVLAHPDADRVERRRTHVPRDGGRHGTGGHGERRSHGDR